MSDTGPLTRDCRGFVRYEGVCLFVRYEGGKIWFPIKHPRARANLGNHVEIAPDDFKELDRQCPEPKQRKPRPREFRAMERAAGNTKRRKAVDKPG